MTELTSLNIKVNRDLKNQADELFNKMGMTLSTAVNVFIRQAVLEQAIPFRIHIGSGSVATSSAKEALRTMQNQAIANGNEHMSMDEVNNCGKRYCV